MNQIDKEEEKQLKIPPMTSSTQNKPQAMSMRPRTVGTGSTLAFNPQSTISKQNAAKQTLQGNLIEFLKY